jgi:HAD superfamily hydrolase (TIGR01509 family)
MDGIITDTSPYHQKGWQIIIRKRGTDYTEAYFWRNASKRSDNIIREVLGENMPQDEITEIIQEKDGIFRQLLLQEIKLFPGVFKLITSLKERDVRVAIASSAPRENILLITRSLKLTNLFDVIVSGWEVTNSEPHSQIFLLVVEKLGVALTDSIVIEDTVSGVTASKRAGIRCIAVTNTISREELREADLIIDSLEEITASDPNRLLK